MSVLRSSKAFQTLAITHDKVLWGYWDLLLGLSIRTWRRYVLIAKVRAYLIAVSRREKLGATLMVLLLWMLHRCGRKQAMRRRP